MTNSPGTRKIKYSVQLQFIAAFFLLIAALLVFLNTYPVIATRDMVFSSKKASMVSQASVMSASLSALDDLTRDGTKQVMDLLDITAYNRVIVTDETGLILYDTSGADSSVGRYALFSELYSALRGQVVFYSKYADGAFMSRTALPVLAAGTVTGAVYLYEYDLDQAALIANIQSKLRSISLIVGAAAVLVVMLFSRALTKRIKDLVLAIRVVSEGDYSYRLEVRGHDELSALVDEFNNLTARLDSTEEMRRRFVSDASHELKTPLASIRLLSDSIVQSSGMDADTMREFVTDIGNEAERLRRTTEKLLSLTRLETSVQPAVHPVDVKQVAENTLRLLVPLADKRRVRLEYKLSAGCVIRATEDDLYQIIFNLVENGIKYNVPEGVVRLLAYPGPDKVNIIVDDTGIGIPKEDMPEIFSRFYRVDKARSSELGGSGIGLSIVHDAVTLHGGAVRVEARKPRGTRFVVTFPLYAAGEGGDGE